MKTILTGRSREFPTPPFLGDGESIPDEIFAYLLRAAAQAPSWYNCQPWRFQAADGCIDINLDDRADGSLYGWRNLNATLACGAALENMVVAAKGRGLAVAIKEFPDSSHPRHVAHVEFSRQEQGKDELRPWWEHLEESIWRRHTNTLMFKEAPLDADALNALETAIKGFPQVSLHMALSHEEKQRVFVAASTAEQVRFARRDLHEQLHRMIRWSKVEAEKNRTGYTLPSMGACGIGETFFRVTRPWAVMRLMNSLGAYKDQAKRACLGLLNCSAVGLLVVNGSTSNEILASGRALERLWLTATNLGLDLQPHSVITLFHWIWQDGGRSRFSRSHQEILDRAFRLYGDAFPDAGIRTGPSRGIFLFRVGKGEPVHGYTLRQDPT